MNTAPKEREPNGENGAVLQDKKGVTSAEVRHSCVCVSDVGARAAYKICACCERGGQDTSYSRLLCFATALAVMLW